MGGQPPRVGTAEPQAGGPAEVDAGALALSDSFRHFADVVPLMLWRSDHRGHAIHHNECWLAFTSSAIWRTVVASKPNSAMAGAAGSTRRISIGMP